MADFYYVTMTWDNWPEGGSYGTMVEAESHEDAEELCRQKMAASRVEEGRDFWENEEEVRDACAGEWRVVDCMKLKDFVRAHADKIDPDWLKPLERPVKEF